MAEVRSLMFSRCSESEENQASMRAEAWVRQLARLDATSGGACDWGFDCQWGCMEFLGKKNSLTQRDEGEEGIT